MRWTSPSLLAAVILLQTPVIQAQDIITTLAGGGTQQHANGVPGTSVASRTPSGSFTLTMPLCRKNMELECAPAEKILSPA